MRRRDWLRSRWVLAAAILLLGACVRYADQAGYREQFFSLFSVGESGSGSPPVAAPTAAGDPDKITVASFNLKWLGYYPKRDNAHLAALLSHFDIVVLQELVAPPYPGTYPNGKARKPDPEARAFFDAMKSRGFDYVLSPSDTGPGKRLHTNSAGTEWFVAFYKPNRVCAEGGTVTVAVCKISGAPTGFISSPLSQNPVFARVPYAFAFGTPSGKGFVLTSVHLQPGSGREDEGRRAREIASATQWIDTAKARANSFAFFLLGDTNIQDCGELQAVMPKGWASLNASCRDTTPAPTDRPYDQVFYKLGNTLVDKGFGLQIIDLVETMKQIWTGPGPYPGNPYNGKLFPQYYSDHDPIVFQLDVSGPTS